VHNNLISVRNKFDEMKALTNKK